MKFNCPSCNASLTAQPEHAGKSVRCPGCDHKLTIPVVVVPQVVTTGPVINTKTAAAGVSTPAGKPLAGAPVAAGKPATEQTTATE